MLVLLVTKQERGGNMTKILTFLLTSIVSGFVIGVVFVSIWPIMDEIKTIGEMRWQHKPATQASSVIKTRQACRLSVYAGSYHCVVRAAKSDRVKAHS